MNTLTSRTRPSSISNDKMLKCPEKQIIHWLNHLHTKSNFGNYFNYKNNRYNIIKLLTKNIDNINLLKYEKESSGEFKIIKKSKSSYIIKHIL